MDVNLMALQKSHSQSSQQLCNLDVLSIELLETSGESVEEAITES